LSPEHDPFVGRTIGGCRIVERVGRGAMAVVYKAEQLSLDRVVALKILDEYSSADGEALPRFFREARSAARLVHPNVVQVYDVGVDQGVPYIVMEFVEGETLFDLLRREGIISATRALEVVRNAALALVRAQEFDIIHRDIKPANIVLSSRGEVKLTDFGLAKAIGDTSVTHAGSTGGLGTPYYMSPEQADGRLLDVRSDIYSLGATFYHLVTGRPPFQGASTADILVGHTSRPLTPACEIEKRVPRAVSELIDKMMAKSPQDRYPSARALVAAISGVKRALAEGAGDRHKPRTDMQHAVGVLNRRHFRRVAADFVAEVRRVEGSPEELEGISSRVKNLSSGGVFVETQKLQPVGSVIEIRFSVGPKVRPMRALGVVRWTSSDPGSQGMGVQFVEVDEGVTSEVDGYVEKRADAQLARDLTRTPLHEAFVRLHSTAQGDALTIAEIARRLDSARGLVRLILRTFEQLGLVVVHGDIVQFLVPAREELAATIARIVER
jgi:uncharacterized protein (TIGR02266 family)